MVEIQHNCFSVTSIIKSRFSFNFFSEATANIIH